MTDPLYSHKDILLINDRLHRTEALLHNLIDKWEILAGGKAHSPTEVQRWLREDMAPAINWSRRYLNRPRPNGTIP